MASSSLVSSPLSSSFSSSWRYHVYPSYHGADVRKSFLSHILKEFRSKGIDPFKDGEVTKSVDFDLIKAIRSSRIAIVILSRNYACSSWCMNELVEIIKCREELGQIVLPIFYKVDPVDVMYQTSEFGKLFMSICKGKTKDSRRIWSQALEKVATIPGYHSPHWDNEAAMIKIIVNDILDILKNSTTSSDFSYLIQNQSLSQVVKQDDIEVPHLGVTQKRLEDKKALLVLDDADNLMQLEAQWFGARSRIIITTPSDRALQLFCVYAFGQTSPYSDYENLAREVTTLTGEHPLGLRSMGSHFRGMSKEEWKNELQRLRSCLDGEILSTIRLTYDSPSGEDRELSNHHQLSLLDDELTDERMEEYPANQFSEDSQEIIITNQYLKENLNMSKRAFKGISNGLLHSIDIYCANTLQHSFASHLSMDFRRKGIYAFVNCEETPNYKVERASASVVVFSKSCFSSASYMDNLVRVLQCQKKTGQLVVPVFYGISPSDVVVQDYDSADRMREWNSALQELRELSGYQLREEYGELELVEEIVKDVCEKLFPAEQTGMNSRLLEIEQLLRKQPWGIRHLGIWGMPGIGKTTLAKEIFNQICGGYEASCFIDDFDKAFHEKGLHQLLEEHFGNFLKELPLVRSSITRPSLPEDKLSNKITLIVLDNVQNPLVAESFLGRFHWLGLGSLIIITSRDKQVFRHCQISHVYEVRSLNHNEALQLFSKCAFGEDKREENLLKLSMEMIDYANGNPLVLSFYGRELKGKKLSEMETTFLKLKLHTPYKIHDLFKSSYETLNNIEKNIFLDIACFFNEENVEYVMQLLEGCGFFPQVGIDVLVEKCLVTISENRVKMHRIVQDCGREIINRETIQIERRRRLWEPWPIKFLLEDDKFKENEEVTYKHVLGTGDIEGIFLDASSLLFDVKPTAFEDMLNLRFLKIYYSSYENPPGLALPKGLESLPYELRLLHWENYPLESLPQDFDPCHLVELNMPYSQLHKFWVGTKNLEMLKMVKLCHSEQLNDIDDLCKAQNIEVIDLQGCTKLKSFPATDQLQHLRVVNLSGCKEIKSFPKVSPNIEELHLQGTGLRELPISIGNATNLKKLYLSGCSSLVELPLSIENAVNLQELNLKNCSSLVELPSSIGKATNLEKLCLTGCSSLVKLPSSLGNATNLQDLNIEYCSSLVELPTLFGNGTNLKILNLTGCSSLVEFPSFVSNHTSVIMSTNLNEDQNQPIVTIRDNLGTRFVEVKRRTKRGNFYVLEGGQKDELSVSVLLRLVNEHGGPRMIYFPFHPKDDTAFKVSREMVEELGLTEVDVTFMAELLDILLVNLIPTWKTEVKVDHLIHSQLNQNESKTKKQEDIAFRDTCESFDLSYPIEGSSSYQEVEEATEPVSLGEEERPRQKLEEIKAMMTRKREEAMMKTKKKRERLRCSSFVSSFFKNSRDFKKSISNKQA